MAEFTTGQASKVELPTSVTVVRRPEYTREWRAHRWFKNGDYPGDGPADQSGKIIKPYYPPAGTFGTCRGCGADLFAHGVTVTGFGAILVCPGDWIVDGEPYSPDEFKALFSEIVAGQKIGCDYREIKPACRMLGYKRVLNRL